MEKITKRLYMNFHRPVSILQALIRGFLVRVRIIKRTKFEYNELQKNIYNRSLRAGISSVLIDSLMNELVICSFRISLDRDIDISLLKKDPVDMSMNNSINDHQKLLGCMRDKQKLQTNNEIYDETYRRTKTFISKELKQNDQVPMRKSIQSSGYLDVSSIAKNHDMTETYEECFDSINFDKLTDQSHNYKGCTIKATNDTNHSNISTFIEANDSSESTSSLEEYEDDMHNLKSSTRLQSCRKRQQDSNYLVDDQGVDFINKIDFSGPLNSIENQIRSARENLKDHLGINS